MTLVHTGTVIHCRGCGREYKRPVVSVDVLNDERRLSDFLEAALTRISQLDLEAIAAKVARDALASAPRRTGVLR